MPEEPADLGVDPFLLSILRCPKPHHGRLEPTLRSDGGELVGELVCVECGTAYPVREGLPVMLVDEAREPGAAG